MNEEQDINRLPKGWKWVKLGEVLSVSSGKGLKVNSLLGGKYAVYGGNGLNGYHSEYLVEEAKLIIGRVGVKCGVTHITKPKSWITDNALIVEPKNEELDIKFLKLKLSFENLNKLSVSTAQPVISGSKIYAYEILLPPKATQQTIVSKIEELFSEIDKGIEQLKTAQQQLKTYRQAVLKWAFEGKLTEEEWRQSSRSLVRIQSGSQIDLMVAEGEATYGKKSDLLEGWKVCKLGKLCNKIQDGSHFSPKIQYDEPGKNRFKYITAKNIRNGYMDFRKVTYVDREFHESIFSRCNPVFGDVLLTKDGVNTGEVTLNTLHEPFSLLSSVCLFKTKEDELRNDFLKYFIQSPLGSKAVLDSMTGTAIKRIILKKIKDSEITLPNIQEQEKIVQEIESRLSVADKMEESINLSLQQAEVLRQSVLKKAFEGKLN